MRGLKRLAHAGIASSPMIVLLLALMTGTAAAQQPDPFGTRRADSPVSSAEEASDQERPLAPAVDERLKTMDSVVYRLARGSRLQVKTVDIRVSTNTLEVLTPPDTAEIRKVTESMRTRILRTAEYPEIRLVSRQVVPSADGFHLIGAITLVGQTRELPIDVTARIGLDTLEAASTFSLKQTDFGIAPFSGGPGGTVKVADRVTFDIRAVAVRVEEQQAHAAREGGSHARRQY